MAKAKECGHELSYDACPTCVAARKDDPRYWVVLSNGDLKDDLTEAQYMRYSERGMTIDGGAC
jgi:hypothetical protein